MPSTASLIITTLVGASHSGSSRAADASIDESIDVLSRFELRLDAVLRQVVELGFTSLELGSSELHWRWATLQHVAIAKRLLKKHELVVRGYNARLDREAEDLHAACRLCVALDIPWLVGDCELFDSERATVVNILREHGVGYARLIREERTVSDVLERLGSGDEDVVGVALDTAEAASRGWHILSAVRGLGGRLFSIRLRDVNTPPDGDSRASNDAQSALETCRLGQGRLPVSGVVQHLRDTGFAGSVTIGDAGGSNALRDAASKEEAREARERVERWLVDVAARQSERPLRVVVIGCGNIAGPYAESMHRHPEIQMLGASDLDLARARGWVDAHGGRVYASLDEVLADDSVECVVNLTIQQAHADVIARSLRAGKHVYSEKPLASNYVQAKALSDLATVEGLVLSCAPITWLGEAQQTAWKLVRENRIGTPRLAYVAADWGRIERWHPNPEPFYAVGPIFDVAVYPISMLTSWFGPVRRVTASGGVLMPERRTLEDKPFRVTSEDWMVAVLEFQNGLRARLTANFYVANPKQGQATLDLHGDDGSISAGWFAAGAHVEFCSNGGSYRRVPLLRQPAETGPWFVDWALGVVDIWRVLRERRSPTATGAQAAHVIGIMEAIHGAAREGRALSVPGDFTRPEPQPWAM